MPSKKDPAQERRTDSWLFRLANKKDSNAQVLCFIAWIVSVTVAVTLLAVQIFR